MKPTAVTAIYTRVSTEDQRSNFSLSAQSECLWKYAEFAKYHVYKEYIEEGHTGTSIDRPAFKQLLADARKKKFEFIIVYKIDRFFRNTKELLNLHDELESLGIKLRSATEPIDTSTHVGKFIFSLMGSVAQLERDTFLERSKLGRLRRAKEGYYSGSNPAKLGYQYNKNTRKLEINPKESQIIELAFKYYNDADSSLLKVAKRLRELGYKTKEGKEFGTYTVHDIIRDPIYIGKWYANRYTKGGKLKPKEEWIEVKVPSIISVPQFQKAQTLLKKRRNYTIRNVKYDYLFQGLIHCGDCGSPVKGTADRQYQVKNGKKYGPYFKLYYRCTHFVKNLFKKRIECGLKYMQAGVLEPVVWGKIEEILAKPELIGEAIMLNEASNDNSKENAKDDITIVENRHKQLLEEEKRILEAYRQNIIGLDKLKEQMRIIKSETEILEKRRSEIDCLTPKAGSRSISKGDILNYLRQIKKAITQYSYESKRRVLGLLNTKMVANVDGKIDLYLKFCSQTIRAFQEENIAKKKGLNTFSYPLSPKHICLLLADFIWRLFQEAFICCS